MTDAVVDILLFIIIIILIIYGYSAYQASKKLPTQIENAVEAGVKSILTPSPSK